MRLRPWNWLRGVSGPLLYLACSAIYLLLAEPQLGAGSLWSMPNVFWVKRVYKLNTFDFLIKPIRKQQPLFHKKLYLLPVFIVEQRKYKVKEYISKHKMTLKIT